MPLRQQQAGRFRQEQQGVAFWKSADRPTCGRPGCGPGSPAARDLVEYLVRGALPLARSADIGERADLHAQLLALNAGNSLGSHNSSTVGMSPSWIRAWWNWFSKRSSVRRWRTASRWDRASMRMLAISASSSDRSGACLP
jgi:hypothetical protein